eukprot:3933767-Rhodomonas_salina.3
MCLRGPPKQSSPDVRETLKENAHPQITQFLSAKSAKCDNQVLSVASSIAKNTRSARVQAADEDPQPLDSGPLSSQEYSTSQEQAL